MESRRARLDKLTLQFDARTIKRLNRISKARKCSVAAVVRDGIDRVLPILEGEVMDRVLAPEPVQAAAV